MLRFRYNVILCDNLAAKLMVVRIFGTNDFYRHFAEPARKDPGFRRANQRFADTAL